MKHNTYPRGRRRKGGGGLLPASALIATVLLIYAFSSGRQSGLPGGAAPIESLSPTSSAAAAAADTPSFSGSDRYYRRLLSPEYQEIYDILRDCVAGHTDSVSFDIDDKGAIADIYTAVIRDHPEYFWVNGASNFLSTEYKSHAEIRFMPEYVCSVSQVLEYSQYIESAIAPPLSQLSGLDDYGKVKGVYEFIINYAQYDPDYSGAALYAFFADHKGVCEQYTQAAQYMLNRLELEAIYVSGDVSNAGGTESHAWIIVKADGDYYNLDVTWGDPITAGGEQTLSYAYLCVTDGDLSATHRRDDDRCPSCSAVKDNYYVREGRLLDSYDPEQLTRWLESACQGDGVLRFRCADGELYRLVKSRFLDGGEIFDMLKNISGGGIRSYSYFCNDDVFTYDVYLDA